jgi:hypothetical protein
LNRFNVIGQWQEHLFSVETAIIVKSTGPSLNIPLSEHYLEPDQMLKHDNKNDDRKNPNRPH